jgi:hypothetical protein
VHLVDTDEARMGADLLRRFTVLDEGASAYRFMRNTGDRCAGLDESIADCHSCLVYVRRPDDCRVMRPGSPDCLEARRVGHMGRTIA